MSQFYIVNERSEDTLEAVGNLQDAIRLAQEVAKQGLAGEPVSILESGGLAVKQFVLMPDGGVAEQPIARPARSAAVATEANPAEPLAHSSPLHK
jgi:hypothetical protein